MTDTKALKPCPFCGGEAKPCNGHVDEPTEIRCVGCKASIHGTEYQHTKRLISWEGNAIDKWNTRADLSSDAVTLRKDTHIAELERQNTDLQANNTKLVLENRELKSEYEVLEGFVQKRLIDLGFGNYPTFSQAFDAIKDRIVTLENKEHDR